MQLGVQRGDIIGMPNVPKNLLMGQSIWLLKKKKENVVLTCAHEL
jgi:hypothetical protein